MPDYSLLTDLELTELLKMQDELAFAQVYKRYWHPLFLHAYKMLEDEDVAKDIIQELFISFWSKSPALQIKTNLKAYLYVMVRNRIINHIRNNKVNDNFISMLAEAMEEADHRTIQDIDSKDLVLLIDQEINLLPPRMKQVFEMSRKQFMSHKEIAAELGTTEETVKKQISKSIKILKIKLDKYGGISAILLEIIRHRV